jgi:GGDEF domain-containing protein
MSEQSTSGIAPPNGERSGRLGRFRSKAAPGTPGAPRASGGPDALTGLPTREHLHGWLNAAVMASRPTSSHSVLAFVDLESLRDVNDSFGPDTGDVVLAQVAVRLSDLGARVLRYGSRSCSRASTA